MRFGIVSPAIPEVPAWSEIAESLGYDSTWLFDSHMVYSDIYVIAALCAERTTRMTVGTGVAVAPSRIAPVTAHSIATLNRLYPGRAILGLGTGNTGRRTMGFPPMKLKDFRTYAGVVKGLLRGETVEYREGDITRPIKLIHPRGPIDIEGPIPVCLAAFAPKAIELAGEIADGFISIWPLPEELAPARKLLERGAQRAGRGLAGEGFRTICFESVYVTRPGERVDSEQAKATIGPAIMSSLRYWFHAGSMWVDDKGKPQGVPEPMANALGKYAAWLKKQGIDPDRDYARFYEHYFLQVPPEHMEFIDSDVVKAMTIAGPPDYCLERVSELKREGADEVAVVLGGNRREQMLRFAEAVIHRWRD